MGNACLHFDEDEEEVTQAGQLEQTRLIWIGLGILRCECWFGGGYSCHLSIAQKSGLLGTFVGIYSMLANVCGYVRRN